MAGDPRTIEPSELVARVLAEGEPAFRVVDFPRRRQDGTVIERVHLRVLSDDEEAVAHAQARQDMGALLRNSSDKADDTLLHNLRVRNMLAVACRRVDDPKRPFFEHGAPEVKQFSTRELAQLWLAYLAVVESDWPALRTLSGEELDLYVKKMAEGVDAFPFYLFSREKLETFSASAATRCNDLAERIRALEAEVEALRAGASNGTGSSGSA